MKASSKRALWIGGLVAAAGAAIGVGVYAASKANAPKQAISVPANLIHGHRYTLTISASSAGIDPSKLGEMNVQAAQELIDQIGGAGNYKVISASAAIQGNQARGTAVFDVLGPTAPVPDIPPQAQQYFASAGGAFTVVDNGKSPAGIAGPPAKGFGAPKPFRAQRLGGLLIVA